jgi:hypothetical protein
MRWSLTKADSGPGQGLQQKAFDDAIRRNLVMAKLDDLVNWGARIQSGLLILAFPAVMLKWQLPLPAAMILPVLAQR